MSNFENSGKQENSEQERRRHECPEEVKQELGNCALLSEEMQRLLGIDYDTPMPDMSSPFA